MNKKILKILKKLEGLGWHRYLDFGYYFQWRDSNRYVEIEYPYIQFETYSNGKKLKGYVSAEAFRLFGLLIKEIERRKRRNSEI